MSASLKFAYFFITFLVGIFSIGQSSIFFFKYFNNKIVRSYAIFMGLLTLKVFSWLAYSFVAVFDFCAPAFTIVYLIGNISIFFFLWALTNFIHLFFKVPFGRWVNYFTLSVAITFSLHYLLTAFGQKFMHGVLDNLYIFSNISIVIFVYSIVIALLFYSRLEDRRMKTIGLTMALVTILFIPALIVDFFFSDFCKRYTILSPFFYITWNILAFYFTVRFHPFSPYERGEAAALSGNDFNRHFDISSREQEILQLILKGCNNREIAEQLFISLSTVKTHLYRIYRKVDVNSRAQLIAKFRDFE